MCEEKKCGVKFVSWEHMKMHKVLELASEALTGHYFKRKVLEKNLCSWMEEVWRPLLVYLPKLYIFIKGRLAFIFKVDEDVVKMILKQ